MPEENPAQSASKTQNNSNSFNAPSTSDTLNVPNSATAPSAPSASPASRPENPIAQPKSPITTTSSPKSQGKWVLPVIIILSVLTLAGIGTSVYSLIQNSDKAAEISDLKNQLSGQDVVIITPDESVDNPSNNETNSIAITTETRDRILASVPGNLVFGDKNALNSDYDLQYSTHDSISSNDGTMISAGLTLTNNTVSLTINWDQIKSAYSFLGLQISSDKTGTEQFSDLGFSGKVTDISLAKFGQAFGDETLCALMEDGTVEYIPIAKALKDNNIRSYGKLPGVENVIKFYKGSSCPKEGYTGCGNNTLAQRADGNYYALYNAIGSTGNLLNYSN